MDREYFRVWCVLGATSVLGFVWSLGMGWGAWAFFLGLEVGSIYGVIAFAVCANRQRCWVDTESKESYTNDVGGWMLPVVIGMGVVFFVLALSGAPVWAKLAVFGVWAYALVVFFYNESVRRWGSVLCRLGWHERNDEGECVRCE